MNTIFSHEWDNAQRVAEQHDPESVADVRIGQARVAFNDQDYSKAESFLLRSVDKERAALFPFLFFVSLQDDQSPMKIPYIFLL